MSDPTMTPQVSRFPLFQGDDLQRIKELREAVEAAFTVEGPRRVGDGPSEAAEAAEAYDAFVAEATERAVMVAVTSRGRKVYAALLDNHPPRDGVQRDQEFGFNEQTLGDDLVPACLVEPTFATDELRDAWIDSLTHAQFRRIFSEAYKLNAELTADPKADLSSRLARISDEI